MVLIYGNSDTCIHTFFDAGGIGEPEAAVVNRCQNAEIKCERHCSTHNDDLMFDITSHQTLIIDQHHHEPNSQCHLYLRMWKNN